MSTKEEMKQELQKQLNRVHDALSRANAIQGTYDYLMERENAKRDTWAKDVVDTNVNLIQTDSEARMEDQWHEGIEAFHKARAMAKACSEFLDVDDQRLAGAVSFIGELDSELIDERAESINDQFAGDQGALRVLDAAYKKKGLNKPGMLLSYMYDDFDCQWDRAQGALSGELQLGGRPNAAGQAMAKVAKFEGVSFDPVIDKSSISSKEQLKNMSLEDINKNWSEVSKFLENS